jgi:hypothetical protein
MAEQVTVRQEVSNSYAIITGVVSAGSVISLIQKIFSVGLVPVLAEFVAYYRKITHFFVDWIVFWVRIPTKSAGDSERRRPPVPIEAGRGFR